MIPRVIHQMWIDPTGGLSSSPPADVMLQCERWENYHPDFIYRRWRLADVTRMCDAVGMDDVVKAINACRLPAMQADIARLAVLRNFGGYWADLKLSPRGAFLARYLEHDLVLTEHFPKENLPDPNGFLASAFLGASAEMVVIAIALEIVVENVAERREGSVFSLTGPLVLMKARDVAVAADPSLGNRITLLRHKDTWDRLFSVGSGSYNKFAGHWSKREVSESLYTK